MPIQLETMQTQHTTNAVLGQSTGAPSKNIKHRASATSSSLVASPTPLQVRVVDYDSAFAAAAAPSIALAERRDDVFRDLRSLALAPSPSSGSLASMDSATASMLSADWSETSPYSMPMWSTSASTSSSSSISTVTDLPTPSLTRSPTPDSLKQPSLTRSSSKSSSRSTLDLPPTPPAELEPELILDSAEINEPPAVALEEETLRDAQDEEEEDLSVYIETSIPTENIHNHVGYWYFPAPAIASRESPSSSSTSNSKTTDFHVGSTTSLASTSSSFSISSLMSSKFSKKSSRHSMISLSPSSSTSTNSSSTSPSPSTAQSSPLARKSSLLHYASRRSDKQRAQQRARELLPPPPAIRIAPPPSGNEPVELYRPSLARLAHKHAKSLGERHPLADSASSSTSGSTASLALSVFSSSSSSDASSISSVSSESSSKSKSKSRFSKTLKSSAKLASNFLQTGVTSLSMPIIALDSSPSPTSPAYSYSSYDSNGRKVVREGGLIVPSPLAPSELDDTRLSLSWETRVKRASRAEKAEKARKQREIDERRRMEENINRYRAPFMGF